jgi:hypothetical protein
MISTKIQNKYTPPKVKQENVIKIINEIENPTPRPPLPANTTVITVSKPSNGTLDIINQDSGAVAYTPNLSFHAKNSFTFKINATEIVTVSITLNSHHLHQKC